ncbi:MAG: cob(I)yrinic acid a,c-diamide adenosyltransferase [Spirochaetales bacterium]|nr:cob(I)yrinic acid a,c-diamide adenosyltransferase [Spirochaetales bacterium]
MKQKGIVIVFTGPGKGKTTAALGVALRALGHGLSACLVQFVKSPKNASGEREAARAFGDRFEIHVLGEGFIFKPDRAAAHRRAAHAAWELAAGKIATGNYDLVILDEIAYPFAYGYVDTGAVLDVIAARPRHVHVCLTGRDMPAEVLAKADLVTSMEEVRHPFRRGMKNIKGIDY